MSGPYTVDLWCSHPDADNDDCATGRDFLTMKQALEYFDNPWSMGPKSQYADCSSIEYIILQGPHGLYREKRNPGYKPTSNNNDDDWQREQAMQAGMMGGCDAYNDAMGY